MSSFPFTEPSTDEFHGLLTSTPPPLIHNANDSKFLKPGDIAHLDGPSSSTLEKNQEQLWEDLTRFYQENEQTIERSMALDAESMSKDDKASELDIAIDTFMETANVILEGLVALGNVHPILGIAIFAFHGIIKLDITRRDNNKKVLAVKLQMQNMMCAMFQLRKLRHVHVQEKEKEQEKARLQRLIRAIANEITKCGSDLNYYIGRKFVTKLINAKSYERRFADHVETFAQRRSELQLTITAYIAAGVDAANIAIAEVGKEIKVMDDKLNLIIAGIFRKLDTPREREVLKFLEQNGGAEQCVAKDELLTKLLTKAGDSPPTGKEVIVKGEELAEVRKALKAELKENLDEVFARHLTRFEKILNVQNNNLKRISYQMEEQGQEMQNHTLKLDKLVKTSILILEEGKLIKKAVVPSLTVTLKDPVLQQIWDRMGLKGSVKAKSFVLNFRDHLFTDLSAATSVAGSPREPLSPLHEHSSLVLSAGDELPKHAPDKLPANLLKSEIDDHWALQYINVAHVQPIVEALDEDGSGYISVKEANKFALSRPKGWSLMQWFAYWAAGWHINVTNYRSKIYSIVQQMHEALLSAHPANRSYIDEYLNDPSLNRTEALLRSIQSLPDGARKESKLADIAESMAVSQEKRLLMNLKEMSFIVESPSDVTLVAGLGRVETWILPLLYLILSRHLDIINLGHGRVLDEKELSSHVKSLTSIFSAFDERMQHLETIFRQVHRDVQSQFEIFAFGMFLTSFVTTENNPSENTLLTFRDNKISMNKIMQDSTKNEPIDLSILTKGLGPTFKFEEVDIKGMPPPENHVPHPIEGVWTGQCIRANNKQIAFQGFFQCTINPIVENKIDGKGETYLGQVEFDGKINEDGASAAGRVPVEFKIYSEVYADLWCKGEYDPDNELIKGQWVIDDDSEKFPPPDDEEEEKALDFELPCGRFYITRTPAVVFRFRHLLDGPSPDPSWTVARKRWAFATEAIRFQTQGLLGSSNFFRARTAERRMWIELTIRRELDKVLVATKGQLSDQGKQDLWTLRLQMHPTNGRLYDSLSMYLFERMTYNVGPYNCHSCDRRITFDRYQCITCMDDKLSNQLDLCGDCIEAPTLSEDGDFVHLVSHSLIRSTHRIHECELASMIPQARLRSERIKASFKALEMKNTSTPNLDIDDLVPSQSSVSPFKCACCSEEIALPCWVCVACALDTFICLDCNLKRRPVLKRQGFSAAHSYDHPLLRFHDSAEVKANEAKPNRLEKKLSEMETRINRGLSSLEEKFNKQLNSAKDEMKIVVESASKNTETGKSSNSPSTNGNLAGLDDEIVAADPTLGAILEEPQTPRIRGADAAQVQASQEDSIAPLETKLEQRLDALEAKVDTQFGLILSLMQQLIPAPAVASVDPATGSIPSDIVEQPFRPSVPSIKSFRQMEREVSKVNNTLGSIRASTDSG